MGVVIVHPSSEATASNDTCDYTALTKAILRAHLMIRY